MQRRDLIKLMGISGLSTFIPNNTKAATLGEGECVTTSDILGPFYTPGAPTTNKISPDGAAGTVLFITGTVYACDCQTPLADAVVDVWQADDAGDYDNIGFNFRGKMFTDEAGNYAFETMLPGKYLNGANYRPRHIHYKSSYQDSNELVTQLYFEGDTSIPIDPWASDESAENRIIPLVEDANGALHGVFDITLDVLLGQENLNQNPTNKPASIQFINPNPANWNTPVSIGIQLSKQAEVELQLIDLKGQVVKTIVKEKRIAGSYNDMLLPLNHLGLRLQNSVYIIRLLLNGQAVDAKRFMLCG